MSVSRCLSFSSLFVFSLVVLLPPVAEAADFRVRSAPRQPVETVAAETVHVPGLDEPVAMLDTTVAGSEVSELTAEEAAFDGTVPLPDGDSLGMRPQPQELAAVAGIPAMQPPAAMTPEVSSANAIQNNIGAIVAGGLNALPPGEVSRPVLDSAGSRRASSQSFRLPELPEFKRAAVQPAVYASPRIAAPQMIEEQAPAPQLLQVAEQVPAQAQAPADPLLSASNSVTEAASTGGAQATPFAASIGQVIANATIGTNNRLKKLEGTLNGIGRDETVAERASLGAQTVQGVTRPAAPVAEAAPAPVAEAPVQLAASTAEPEGFRSYAGAIDMGAAPHLIGALLDGEGEPAAASAAPAPAATPAPAGEALRVVDEVQGPATALDGATLLLDGVEVHLFGIAIPGDAGVHAERARAALDDLVANRVVTCSLFGKKGMAPALPGRCATDTHADLGLALLGAGLVSVDRRATLGVDVAATYDAAEKAARDNKLGLWGAQPAAAKGNGKVDGWQFVFGSLAGVGIISFFLWWGLKGITMTQRDLAQEQRRRERAHLRRDAMSMSAAIRGELVAAKLACKRFRQQLLDFRRDPKNTVLQARPTISTRVFDANASRVALLGPTLAENLAELYASFHQDQAARSLDLRGGAIDEVCDDSDNHALYLMEQIDMAILDLENYAKLPSVLPLADQAAQRAKLQSPERADRSTAGLTPDLRVVG